MAPSTARTALARWPGVERSHFAEPKTGPGAPGPGRLLADANKQKRVHRRSWSTPGGRVGQRITRRTWNRCSRRCRPRCAVSGRRTSPTPWWTCSSSLEKRCSCEWRRRRCRSRPGRYGGSSRWSAERKRSRPCGGGRGERGRRCERPAPTGDPGGGRQPVAQPGGSPTRRLRGQPGHPLRLSPSVGSRGRSVPAWPKEREAPPACLRRSTGHGCHDQRDEMWGWCLLHRRPRRRTSSQAAAVCGTRRCQCQKAQSAHVERA